MEILLIVGQWILPFLGGLLIILVIAGVKKLLDKMGVDRSEKVDNLIDRYVRMGISAAEIAGKKYLTAQGVKLASGSKKARAVNTVLRELEQSGIKGVAEELISDRIEHWLGVDGYYPGVESMKKTSDPQKSGETA